MLKKRYLRKLIVFNYKILFLTFNLNSPKMYNIPSPSLYVSVGSHYLLSCNKILSMFNSWRYSGISTLNKNTFEDVPSLSFLITI